MEQRPQVTAWLTEDGHPALEAPLNARVDYVSVVAAFVSGGEGEPDKDEYRRLRALCRTIKLPSHFADELLASAEPTERVRERLYRLRDSPLRLSVVRDMVLLGYGHGRYGPAERRKVRSLATLMVVGEEEVQAVEDEVSADLHDDVSGYGATAEIEDTPGAWGGVVRLYRRLVGTFTDED